MNLAGYYNAIGDGVADDTAALQAWLTGLGTGYYETGIVGPGTGFLPAGKYKFTSALTIPANAKISGVPGKSVLVPTSAISSAAVIMLSGSMMDGIAVDGINAGASKIGISIGAAALANNVTLRDVSSARFTGTAGLGLLNANGVIVLAENCDFTGNTHGAKCFSAGAGTPTNVKFDHCRFKANTRRGLWCQSGTGILVFNCDAELNGEEGYFVHDAGTDTIHNFQIISGHIEGNQQSLALGGTRHAAYQIYMRGVVLPVLRDIYTVGGVNEAVLVNMNATVDGVIDHPNIDNSTAGQIVLSNGATTTITNWPESNGSIDTTISDISTYGNTSYLYEKRGSFVPALTFATPGDLAVTASTAVGRYTRRGNRVILNVVYQTSAFTHTTSSGALKITLGSFPYSSKNVVDGVSIGVCVWRGIVKTNYTNIVAHISGNTAFVDFLASGSGQSASNVASADMPTGGMVLIEFTIEFEI